MAVLVFFEDSQGKRQTFECPELPEAPQGSIFSSGFGWDRLLASRRGGRVDFYNASADELSAFATVEKTAGGIAVAVRITELEIRGFHVFKTIEFQGVKPASIQGGFRVGFESEGRDASYFFSPEEVKELF
ncbi:MAG: hypothetical protein HY367_00260 [Candidatus Aenigmarchaeota archaeon]|nr:hypothetical protein [Candidatus Aenigmarchaeota archaeon]